MSRLALQPFQQFRQFQQFQQFRQFQSLQSLQSFHDVPVDRLRNFCIVAHVDHGKSTLADRLLELTGAKGAASASSPASAPSLDNLPVERARGITVKTRTASLPYRGHLLNLMDTPGHVDFSGEVARAVAACQGAVLVVDASQGIQPQTIANLERAKHMAIVPVANKVDLQTAQTDRVCAELADLLGVDSGSVLRVSAKTGLNCATVLDRIISDTPPPASAPDGPFSALIVDSWYDEFRGVICLVSVLAGSVRRSDQIALHSDRTRVVQVGEVGHLTPSPVPSLLLSAGHLGYLVTGIKSIRPICIGDRFLAAGAAADQAASPHGATIEASRPTVFAGLFPKYSSEHQPLSKALEKLVLNDPSVQLDKAHSSVLGAGWRLGFLGSLHMDVFRERLAGEFKADSILTLPSVAFKVVHKDGTARTVNSPQHFPDHQRMHNVRCIEEPVCRVSIATRSDYLGPVLALVGEHRGTNAVPEYLPHDKLQVTADVPLLELISGFHDKLQSRCAGCCSFDYEQQGFVESDIVHVRVLVNQEPADMLSFLCHHSTARGKAVQLLTRLKTAISRQQFEVVLQAAVGGKIIARDGLSALRKDVTAKCYGGDGTRKQKLLDKQKEGKERLKAIGRVSIDPEALSDLMRIR